MSEWNVMRRSWQKARAKCFQRTDSCRFVLSVRALIRPAHRLLFGALLLGGLESRGGRTSVARLQAPTGRYRNDILLESLRLRMSCYRC